MSIKALSDYTFYSRYSQYLPEAKRRETWDEAVKRVFDMHRKKYTNEIAASQELKDDIDFAERQVQKKRVLGSQRALQYAGDPTLRRMERIYNCSGIRICKPKAFQDVVWLLLAGCGVGISVQYKDINKLPKIKKPTGPIKKYVVPDSCEGWADSIGVLLSTYFVTGGMFPEYINHKVEFDYSQIRPKGALIAGQFSAPGSESLMKGHEKIIKLLDGMFTETDDVTQLLPIVCYDLIMHCADFIVAGGLRRSALICLFSKEDSEMASAKTGDWFIKNPQRARSNNSVVVKRDEIEREEFANIFENIKKYGEPGWMFVDDYNQMANPCLEICWIIEEDDNDPECKVGFCNLSEINGRYCSNKENFLQACKAASIIGTLQAGYDEFPYLGKTTEEFVKREALLGVSITGWMDNPEVLFNPEILEAGAQQVKETNAKIAKLININPAARTNCAKPSGHTSCILSTASGIHPHHAKRYIRRVQSNKQEFALDVFKKYNPIAVQESVWSANKTDDVVSFLCEVPAGAVLKNQLSAVELLDKVKLAQKHWVIAGKNDEYNLYKGLSHSVSNTITVNPDEWDVVEDYIFNNRDYFTGISLLPSSGDLDYAQAPFSTILCPSELFREYGDASVFASGLIVDGLHAFENNLWKGCDKVLGIGGVMSGIIEPEYPKERNYKALAEYFSKKDIFEKYQLKIDWIRRVKQFADRYFDGDVRKTTYCLKHVSLWKTWCDLKREYKEINWLSAVEDKRELKNIDEQAAVACSGGKCDITF